MRFSSMIPALLAACLLRPAGVLQAGDDSPSVWPNSVSRANGDPWLMENHTRIRRMERDGALLPEPAVAGTES